MKISFNRFIICIISTLWITGCASTHTEDYAKNTPSLDIRNYFQGNLTAHGIIFDWKGNASRHFVAKLNGTWEGNKGILAEEFTFSDGKTQQRTWQINFTDEHFFTASAGDVIGTAQGSQHGNAVNMEYVLAHKEDDGTTINLTVDDWMFLTKDNILLNRSTLYKYGVPVGEVFISFTKETLASPPLKKATP